MYNIGFLLTIIWHRKKATQLSVVHAMSERACAYLPSPEVHTSIPSAQSRPRVGSTTQLLKVSAPCVPPPAFLLGSLRGWERLSFPVGKGFAASPPGLSGCTQPLLDSNKPSQARHFTSRELCLPDRGFSIVGAFLSPFHTFTKLHNSLVVACAFLRPSWSCPLPRGSLVCLGT